MGSLIDVLHELIAQETNKEYHGEYSSADGWKGKKGYDLWNMRRLGKRDAYYRVIHILRGHDAEFPTPVDLVAEHSPFPGRSKEWYKRKEYEGSKTDETNRF